MSLVYSPVSVCSCSLSVVLTIYSKDQVTADLWLLQRSVNYTLLSIAGFLWRFFLLRIEWKVVIVFFCYRDDLDKMVSVKNCWRYTLSLWWQESISAVRFTCFFGHSERASRNCRDMWVRRVSFWLSCHRDSAAGAAGEQVVTCH